MPLSTAGILSVAVFILVGYACVRNGFFSAVVMLFVTVLSAMTAMALLVPLWHIPLFGHMGWYAPPILFTATFLVSVGIMQTVANYLLPPRLVLPKSVDVGGGAVLGLLMAYFMTGVLTTAFAMFPGTGAEHDKVVFLNADGFFAHTMAWASRRSGAVALDAERFLAGIRKEKYQYSLKEMKDDDVRNEWDTCMRRLGQLSRLLREYMAEKGAYPQKLEDVLQYAPRKMTPEREWEMTTCPATHWRYRLFPVEDFSEHDGDRDFILIYDAIGGDAGHGGRQAGKRVVVTANEKNDVVWIKEETFRVQIQRQWDAYNARKAAREAENAKEKEE